MPLITNNDNDGTFSIPLQQFNSPLQQCCPINPVVVEKDDNEEEKEAELHEHGFGNVFAQYSNGDDDGSGNGNGFASTMEKMTMEL